jgi:hypothetical protein
MVEIGALFAAYAWEYEEPEPGVWRATFATEREEDYDLYVMAGEEWVHFAVSPLVKVAPGADGARLAQALAYANQRLRLARLAIDDEGDVNLLADWPRDRLNADDFARLVDLLVQTTDALAHELRRVGHEPSYYSAKLGPA